MLAYDLKAILKIVPEAMPLIKQASIEQEFPIDSQDSYIASVLRFEYLTKVAHTVVDYDAYTTLEKAASMYQIEAELKPLVEKIRSVGMDSLLEKSASESTSLMEVEASIRDMVSGYADLEKAAELAEGLYEVYGSDSLSEDIAKYAGVGYLNKEASVKGMISRYQASKNHTFIKLARILTDLDETKVGREDLVKLASVVGGLEKESNILGLGFNFYEEAIVKSAASILEISLAGTKVPYEKIAKLGKDRIASVIGKDVADEIKNDPVNDKYVLESLPLDLQKILLSVLKSV